MKDHVAAFRQADGLAREVLDLARSTLLVHLRFLELALSRFTPASYPGTLATDGQRLYYDVYYLLSAYRQEQNRPARDYLHMVLHCVFHHLFTGPGLDRRCWDLACDIAVEAAIRDLGLPCTACRRERAQEETLAALEEQVRPLTAEKLYRHFLDQHLREDQIAQLRQPFLADDHRAWYLPVKGGGTPGGQGQEPPPEGGLPARDKQGQGGASARQKKQDPRSAAEEREKLEREWKEISRRIQVDLETASRRHGLDAGSLVQSLRPVTREHYDYADFLRRYMALGEVMQINDDEFDYIFYTYGLSLYGNMPLVEPLEYKEVRRVRELAVAIDTSGSVSGELVQRFVSKTYDLLCQQENFFTKINLHILQCDAKVQEDVHITCRKDFEDYLEHMELRGFGGTDFRPVFQYVDQLIHDGAFTNLRGLIYFTDGNGIFPERKPDYDAAFVFVDDDGNSPEVPVWAIKLVLQRGEI